MLQRHAEKNNRKVGITIEKWSSDVISLLSNLINLIFPLKVLLMCLWVTEELGDVQSKAVIAVDAGDIRLEK